MNISTSITSKNIFDHQLLFQCQKYIYIWNSLILSLNVKIKITYYELKWKDEIQKFK
jgi:hypothetical protein